MAAPPGQPVEIHQRLMVPCWAASPSDRSGILAMYAAAVSLGATPDDLARDEMQLPAVLSPTTLGSHDTLLRGPSIHHLTSVAQPAALQAVREHMPSGCTPMAGFDQLQGPRDGEAAQQGTISRWWISTGCPGGAAIRSPARTKLDTSVKLAMSW